jgi:DNA repair exonuclease SbcCD nuclease subunit
MSRQSNSELQMANYLSHIGYLIKGPIISKTELGDLLRHLQWNPPQTLHPNTQRICEQLIQNITEIINNDEPPIDRNMELLSKTLEDITKIILSESRQKRTDLLNLCINKEKEAQQLQQTETINLVRTTIQAIINHLFHSSRARPTEKEDQQVPKVTGQEEEKNLY